MFIRYSNEECDFIKTKKLDEVRKERVLCCFTLVELGHQEIEFS